MEGDGLKWSIIYEKLSEFKENENHFSNKFSVGNVPWRSCIKKMGNFLCLELECTKKKELKSSWSCYARIKLCLLKINHIVGVSRETTIELHAGEMCSFPKFILWADVLNPEEGYIMDDSIRVGVHLTTNLNSLTTKELNGFSGLTKNWNNSYLNCLLQILFFTKPLRSAIFRIPVGSGASKACEVLELQRIFYELQSGTRPVEPMKLIELFDEEMKHNLLTENTVEFIGQFLRKLDGEMKGTQVEGTIPRLFQGKKLSSIRCRNVNYCKSDVEIFYHINLNSGKNKNIHEAFKRNITSKRELSGKNRFDAGEYGLQKADQSTEYQLFPPFLHIHLNRCYRRGGFRKKYHGYFEFSKNICLDEYLQKPDPKNPANYSLHAVVVHAGNHEEGHYSLYIHFKVNDTSTWSKFDDDIVSVCNEENAIDANFGIPCDEPTVLETSSTTACMLVYVRDSELPCLSQMMKKSDIPSNLLNSLNGDLSITVNVVLEESFKENEGHDLYDEQKIHYREFKMKKNATVENLIKAISKDFEQSPEKIRLWPFSLRSNRTFRPSFLDLQNVSKKNIRDVMGNEKFWNIFLELLPCDSTDLIDLREFDKMKDVLLFFKMYDPKLRKIQYFGHSYIPHSGKVTELIQVLNKKAGFPQETELLLYEEIGPNMVEKIKNHSEYLRKGMRELVDGSIIIFEKKEFFELPTCVHYFKDLFYRIEVTFIDRDVPNDNGFKIKLSRDTNYDQLAWAVSKQIDANPHSLVFFHCQRDKATPDIHIKNDYEGTLDDLLYFDKFKISNTLFYKNYKIHGRKLDQKKQFTCLYFSSKLNLQKEFSLYIKENGTVSDFLVTVKKYIEMTEGIEGKLRLLDINCYNMAMNPKKISENNKNIWRIEDNDDLEDELLICCIKFHGEIFSTFDTPFLVKIKQGEPFAHVKERIRKKLSLSEKDWKKFKIAIVHMGEIDIVEYIVNFSDFILPQDQSGTLDYYISIVEDKKSEDGKCNDEKIPSCASCGPAVKYREMDSSKSDFLEFSRESCEDHSLNIFSALESKVSFLQDNNYLLKSEISILKKRLQENDSPSYQNKLSPRIVESVSNMNHGKITLTKKRREIPKNYEL